MSIDCRKPNRNLPWGLGKDKPPCFNSINLMESKFGCGVDIGRLRDINLFFYGHDKFLQHAVGKEIERLKGILEESGLDVTSISYGVGTFLYGTREVREEIHEGPSRLQILWHLV